MHFHAHLDVVADGRPVTVPAYVGIDQGERRISPLHTHSDSGILHVEAEEDEAVTLGQFLTQWGVRASKTCIGAYCAPEDPIDVYVDGVKQAGPAVDLVIKANAQIALILGPPPAQIPATYDCASSKESSSCRDIPQP